MNARLRNTAEDTAISDAAMAGAHEEIRQFVERVERLEAEKRDIAEQVKEVFAEAKGRGYSVKALKAVVKMRRMDRNDLAEFEALTEMYRAAVGL